MARKKRGKPHEEEAGEAWLLPYSDMMTLLLALFIVLYGMGSGTDAGKVEKMGAAFRSAFSLGGGPMFFSGAGTFLGSYGDLPSTESKGNGEYIKENQQLENLQRTMNRYIEQNHMQEQLSTSLMESGLMIRIKEQALFPSGSAELLPESQKIGVVVAGLLATMPEQILISGHTDNIPINTPQYPSNWELSNQRALNFLKYILAANPKLDPRRFSAIGYGEYRPAAPNDTEEGRSKNRRVEIMVSRMYRMQDDTQKIK